MNRNPIYTPSELKAPENLFPIVFSANDNYAKYAGVAIQSIICNASPCNVYRIYILHTSISANHIKELEGMSTGNVTVKCLNIEHLIRDIQTPFPTLGYITKEAYYRIFIPEIDEFRSYPYVIYLDCDIIVNSDIAEIVPQEMGNKLIAGVRDYVMMGEDDKQRLERDLDLDATQYINSGVLVINVPQWIQEKTSKKCIDFLDSIPPEIYVFMDQDIINAVCKNRIFYLDEAWNFSWYSIYGDEKAVERCKAISTRIGDQFHILHFAAPFKPWSSIEYPLAHYFWKYAGQSPFLEEIIEKNLCSKAELESNLPYIRIGRTITFIPRKLYGGIKCVRDHGAGYTVRRALYHMGLWKDEEAPKGPENRAKLILCIQRVLPFEKDKQNKQHRKEGSL